MEEELINYLVDPLEGNLIWATPIPFRASEWTKKIQLSPSTKQVHSIFNVYNDNILLCSFKGVNVEPIFKNHDLVSHIPDPHACSHDSSDDNNK
jgi:hypothetical protein